MKIVRRDLQDRPTLDPRRLARVVTVVRERTGAPERGAVGFAFVDDRRMAREHGRFLGLEVTTDVLSFPAAEEVDAAAAGDEEGPYWGDVIICTDQARRQALELGHPYGFELIVLALHGLLHLRGFDHTRDRGEMRRLEERLRPLCAAGPVSP